MKADTKKSKRISVVDLLRFVACCFIIWFHTPDLRDVNNLHEFPFVGAFLFVELFFILMGYFTYRHFRKTSNEQSLETKAKRSLSYTWKKFSSYLPYTIFAVLIVYAVRLLDPGLIITSKIDILLYFKHFLAELFLLNISGGGQLGLTWYLSAALVVFPLFCMICQSRNQRLLYVVLLPFCVIFYLCFYSASLGGVGPVLRAFAGLSLGVLSYALSERLKQLNCKKWFSFLLSLIELLSFMLAIVLLYTRNESLVRHEHLFIFSVVFCFFITLVLLLSTKTLQSKIKLWLFDFLGKISLQMYLFHQFFHWLILFFANALPVATKMALLYGGTIAMSVAVYAIVELAKERLPSIKDVVINESD